MPEQPDHTGIVKQHFEYSYRDYDRIIPELVPGYDDLKKATIVGIEENISEGSNILDLGCGTGILGDEVLRSSHNYNLYGMDISHHMIEEAGKRLARFPTRAHLMEFDFLKIDTIAMPVLRGVVSMLAIHHFENKQALYEKIQKLLKPHGGAFILSDLVVDPNKNPSVMEFRRQHMLQAGLTQQQIDEWFAIFNEEDRPSSVDENLQMLNAAGFKTAVTWQNPSYATFVARI